MLDRLNVDPWDDADEDEREASLMMATARLDLEAWRGQVTETTQRLQWPRKYVYDRNGTLYAIDAIPRPIQEATYELALAILDDPEVLGGGDSLAEFQNLRLGSLDITPRVTGSTPLPVQVSRLLAELRIAGAFQNRVVRA